MQRRVYAQNLVASLAVVCLGAALLAFGSRFSAASQTVVRRTPVTVQSQLTADRLRLTADEPRVTDGRLSEPTVSARPVIGDDGTESGGDDRSATVSEGDSIESAGSSTSVAAATASVVGELATVARVIDGDTIVLTSGQTVRYIGIDTPEATGDRLDCFGREAAARNLELVNGKTVQLTRDVSETDRYGRLLRFVWLNDQLINEQLIREGYARASTFPPDVARAEQLVAAERAARAAGLGLWSGCPAGVTRSDYDPTVPQATTRDCPADRPIKGNAQSKIYHLPGQKYYAATRPETCFATETEAKAAGYRKAKI